MVGAHSVNLTIQVQEKTSRLFTAYSAYGDYLHGHSFFRDSHVACKTAGHLNLTKPVEAARECYIGAGAYRRRQMPALYPPSQNTDSSRLMCATNSERPSILVPLLIGGLNVKVPAFSIRTWIADF